MSDATQCPLGGPRCPESICDCFIEQYPDDPMGLHPEAFVVMTPNGPFYPAPIGWFQFGTHVDSPGHLLFSDEYDEGGLPRWEKPCPGCPVCDAMRDAGT